MTMPKTAGAEASIRCMRKTSVTRCLPRRKEFLHDLIPLRRPERFFISTPFGEIEKYYKEVERWQRLN